jgi:hypothetical protein
MVGAPGGQTTAAQKQSLAVMFLSQEIALTEMSQQQQASTGGLGPWTGGRKAEAPSSSMETTAREKVFMVLVVCLFVCLGVSV